MVPEDFLIVTLIENPRADARKESGKPSYTVFMMAANSVQQSEEVIAYVHFEISMYKEC